MHALERDFSIRAACVQHDCATCASMQRDAVTAAQSRFLATLTFVNRPIPFTYIPPTGNKRGRKPIAMYVIAGHSRR